MAQYQDLISNPSGWIHDLAKGEIHPEAEKLLQLGKGYDPQQLIEESTISFLEELRAHFSEFSKVFNSYSEGGNRFQEIKIYSIAQSASDFMLYRNQIKLIISNPSHGMIQISWSKHSGKALSVDGALGGDSEHAHGPRDLMAQLGPFQNVHWTFEGEKVEPLQVAKFFFTEFVRVTRNPQKSKATNQMLLEEIKTLLKDKGIDL